LIGNLAVVALFVLGWAHVRYWLRGMPRPYRVVLFGLTMGVGTIATMSMAIPFQPGVYFDLRSSLLVVSAFFGGVPAALISGSIALGFRLILGGPGVYAGMVGIIIASLLGLALHLEAHKRALTLWHLVALGLAASTATGACLLILPADIAGKAMAQFGPLIMAFNFLATALAGLVHLQARRLSAERDLLAAALAQAPDLTYVKDRRGRFAAVNVAMAQAKGFATPDALLGKTDFDIESPERAEILFLREQSVQSTGKPMLDLEEKVAGKGWFAASIVPLRDTMDEVIGLAGVTRDITKERKLQQELVQSRDTVAFALQEMSDGLAMFDAQGFLVFCNEQYRQSFPLTGAMRLPGVHMTAILRAVIETGEQRTAPQENAEWWVDEVAGNLLRESEEQVNLFDGRWLQIRTRLASTGATLVVVTDITRLKQAELALHSAADELKELVRTDSLTGLLNRRAFDDAMETEIRRSGRTASPLSLLLIDVDCFKRYNDHYGHPGGDTVLRQVGEMLKTNLKRLGDLAARYGGEEFAAILPETDEDGAYLVAEAFRRALSDARIPHGGSERGYLTASVGVATYMPDNSNRSGSELIRVADEALYSAKAAGRDRVFGKPVAAQQRRLASR
jgi:diguanylate cyclase (GGDEF)-like protein/PAS domain S-box-containing protein